MFLKLVFLYKKKVKVDTGFMEYVFVMDKGG